MLTVLVLYRAVRRVAGAGAGLVAAVVLAGSPVVILLDRGNISDSLLILLLVLAADATIRACQTGRLRSLLWAGRTGGPRIPDQDAPGLDRPPGVLHRLPGGGTGRLASCAACGTWRRPRSWWRSSRSATCRPSRSCRSPVARTSTGAVTTRSSPRCSRTTGSAASARPPPTRAGCTRSSTWLLHVGGATPPDPASAPSASGPHGIACCTAPSVTTRPGCCCPTVASAVWLIVLRRRTPRTDIRRAAVDPVVRSGSSSPSASSAVGSTSTRTTWPR